MMRDKFGRTIHVRTVTPTFKAEQSYETEQAFINARKTGDTNAIAFALRAWQDARSLIVRY